MTTLLRHLFLAMLVLLFAFGCQEQDQDPINSLTFDDVEGVTLSWEIDFNQDSIDITQLTGYEWFAADRTIYVEIYDKRLDLGVAADACSLYASHNCGEEYEEYRLFPSTIEVDVEDYESDDILELVLANLPSWDFVSWQPASHESWVTELEGEPRDLNGTLYPESDPEYDVRLSQADATIDEMFSGLDEMPIDTDLDQYLRKMLE